MDYYSDYERFLRETADEIGNLVSYKQNLYRFRQQARLFVKQYETHREAVEQLEKAPTDPRLCDYSKGSPGPGWRWISTLELSGKNLTTNGHWAPSDDQLPPDPLEWFSCPPVVIGASHEAEQPCCEKIELPCRETLLPCCYVLLITVHDKGCPPGFPLISEGILSQEKGDFWHCGGLGYELQNTVFKGDRKFQFKRKIEWALKQVKANLPEKTTEQGKKAGKKPSRTIIDDTCEHPNDLIALKVAVKDYEVSRATLKRKIKDGIIKSYREKDSKPNTKHKVSRAEVRNLYPVREIVIRHEHPPK